MWDVWVNRWEKALNACISYHGGSVDQLHIAQPATTHQISEIERELDVNLPLSFRTTLLQFSSEVHVRWLLPDHDPITLALREIFGGLCNWSLNKLIELEQVRHQWIESCFPDLNDRYDRVWHNKLAFHQVPNGDMLAFDLASSHEPPVVYLSHDDGEGHGYILGQTFEEFIDNWTILGCPGSEDWQMLPFIFSPKSGLLPHGLNGRIWRDWFFKGIVPPREPMSSPIQAEFDKMGMVKCPNCGWRFSLKDKDKWVDGYHKTCKQRLILVPK